MLDLDFHRCIVPYQRFTNSIENYFSILKARLQKLDGVTHAKLKEKRTNSCFINVVNEIT
jgi:hypothetical protein